MSPSQPSRRRPHASGSSAPKPEPIAESPSVRLSESHDLSRFACGHEDLDDWLRDSAMHADASGTARTWVWATDRLDVLAYYSIAPHLILRDKLPTKVGHGSPDQIPSVLLARLALDRSLQGQGLGAALLADALSRVVAGIEKVGGRLIVVDAIDLEAAGFYRRHGFVPTETDPRRLVIKASVVRRSL